MFRCCFNRKSVAEIRTKYIAIANVPGIFMTGICEPVI
jgi:hypothetical protein